MHGNFFDEPKKKGKEMNKNCVSIADNLIKKEHMFLVIMSFKSVKYGFVLKNISASEIENYINPSKSVRSDVPSICFVKLSKKYFLPTNINCIIIM